MKVMSLTLKPAVWSTAELQMPLNPCNPQKYMQQPAKRSAKNSKCKELEVRNQPNGAQRTQTKLRNLPNGVQRTQTKVRNLPNGMQRTQTKEPAKRSAKNSNSGTCQTESKELKVRNPKPTDYVTLRTLCRRSHSSKP